jgi:hypothetical protein
MSYNNYSNINIIDNLYQDIKNKKKKSDTQSIVANIDMYEQNTKYSNDDDLSSMFYKLLIQFNFKIAILLFIFYIIFNTDIFLKYVLSKFGKNIYNNDKLSEKGLIIVGILLSLTYIILNVLDNNNYI